MRLDVAYGLSVYVPHMEWTKVPNPDRHWWQFWRPKLVNQGQSAALVITDCR
jgi:hypothetical protein